MKFELDGVEGNTSSQLMEAYDNQHELSVYLDEWTTQESQQRRSFMRKAEELALTPEQRVLSARLADLEKLLDIVRSDLYALIARGDPYNEGIKRNYHLLKALKDLQRG